jgi:hypothetical protein
MGKLTYQEFKTMGSGSLIDSDMIDGYHASISDTANTAVIRGSGGDIYGRYILSNRPAENSLATQYIYDSGNGAMRKKDLANVKSEIVTSAAIISGLGYTPYNSTNPNGYITSAGNSATATKLVTARTINGTTFDGTANISIRAFYGTSNDYNGSGVEVVGNGAANTIFPSIGFHQPTLYAASIRLISASEFGLYTQGGVNYANLNCNNLNCFTMNPTGRITTSSDMYFSNAANGKIYFAPGAGGIYSDNAACWVVTKDVGNNMHLRSQAGVYIDGNTVVLGDSLGNNRTIITPTAGKLTFNGEIATHSVFINGAATSTGIFSGNGDGASYATCNMDLKSWYGIGIIGTAGNPYGDGTRTMFIDARTGSLTMKGDLVAARVYNAVYNDYAEYFLKDDNTLKPGDLVITNPDGDGYVKSRHAYDKLVVGVYSDDYAQCIGGEGKETDKENYAAIGMAGRVRVKVIGKVEKGDLLVSSDIPGVAMVSKEYKLGTIIGKVLENSNEDSIRRIQTLILNM